MKEITTDLWALLLPEEWTANQQEETVIINDNDEVSLIEVTTILPEAGATVTSVLEQFSKDKHKTVLADLTAYYHQLEEEGMFWREWYCDAENAVLVISHGCDTDHKHYDDSTVDEILSTLVLVKN